MAGTIDTGTAPSPAPLAPEKHPRRWPWALASAVIALGVGIGIGAAAHTSVTTKTVTQTQTVPGPTVTQTETVTASPSATPGQVLLSKSGSGNGGTTWNSQPFEVSGDSPVLKVTYSYWGNVDSIIGQASNFIMDISSASDNIGVANTVASSGGTTTMAYPDTSMGDTTYHVEIQASGHWTFTITQVS